MKFTFHNQFLLHHAFGFQKIKDRRTTSAPMGFYLWWARFKTHGWRNWRRGYRDEDVQSMQHKLSYPPKPGEVTYLTSREMNVFRDWYRQGRGLQA